MGNYDEAIIAYDKALELDPDFLEAWYYKGVDLDSLGSYRQALKAYEKLWNWILRTMMPGTIWE